jgi:hypothetical protein
MFFTDWWLTALFYSGDVLNTGFREPSGMDIAVDLQSSDAQASDAVGLNPPLPGERILPPIADSGGKLPGD